MNAALKIYSSAGDLYSQVRVLCFLGQEAKAAELARSGTDKAAYYHMARHYEAIENIEEAVAFFNRANAYGSLPLFLSYIVSYKSISFPLMVGYGRCHICFNFF